MHIVTKFLVVLAAVLSMVLAGLAIAYSSNAERIVGDLRIERDRAAKAEGQASAVTATAAGERESQQQKIAALESTLQAMTGKLASLQSENAKLLAEVNSLKQNALTHSAQIDQFTAVVQTNAALSKSQTEELNALRDKELAYNKREIEVTDRVNDLQGELEVSRESNRSLQEQLVQIREQLGRAERGGVAASGSPSEGVYLRAPADFRGKVKSVRQDTSGNTLVEIDAGATSKLRERMKLNIVRGGFLATLILERVDQNESVGRVDFLGRKDKVQIQAGDLVTPTL